MVRGQSPWVLQVRSISGRRISSRAPRRWGWGRRGCRRSRNCGRWAARRAGRGWARRRGRGDAGRRAGEQRGDLRRAAGARGRGAGGSRSGENGAGWGMRAGQVSGLYRTHRTSIGHRTRPGRSAWPEARAAPPCRPGCATGSALISARGPGAGRPRRGHVAIERVEAEVEVVGHAARGARHRARRPSGPRGPDRGPSRLLAPRQAGQRAGRVSSRPSGRLAEDVQAVADLRLLQLAEIGVELARGRCLRPRRSCRRRRRARWRSRSATGSRGAGGRCRRGSTPAAS
jgi:hypothetical protein